MALTQEELRLVLTLRDQTSGTISRVKRELVGMAGRFIAFETARRTLIGSAKAFSQYEANLISIKNIAGVTGRDVNEVFASMDQQLTGMASKASIATGMLRGLTTTLTVEQLGKMTSAIRDASVAMGEDFNVQIPLIIKGLKLLNPNILDNIGVTVRLDQVNKRIRDGYYGLNTAVNEATQQQAIYNEIIKQTQRFRGQEAALLGTVRGQYGLLKAATSDLAISFGRVFASGDSARGIIGSLAGFVKNLSAALDEINPDLTKMTDETDRLTEAQVGLIEKTGRLTGILSGSLYRDFLTVIRDAVIGVNRLGISFTQAFLDGSLLTTVIDGLDEALQEFDRGIDPIVKRAPLLSELYIRALNMVEDELDDMAEVSAAVARSMSNDPVSIIAAWGSTAEQFNWIMQRNFWGPIQRAREEGKQAEREAEAARKQSERLRKREERELQRHYEALQREQEQFIGGMATMASGYVSELGAALLTGEQMAAASFSRMLQSFLQRFINQAVNSILTKLFPALLGIIPGFSPFGAVSGILSGGGSSPTDVPNLGFAGKAAGGGQSAGVVINNYNGVTMDDFINGQVLPAASRATRNRQVTVFNATDDVVLGGSLVYRA